MPFTVNQEKSTAELAYELATGISGLGSDDIANESGATGTTVSDALDSVKSIADSKITTGASVGGDLSGTIASATVAKIQGRAMAATAPTTDQCIQWNGSTWLPATITSTQITNSSTVSGTGVTGALNTLAAKADPLSTGSDITGATTLAGSDKNKIREVKGNACAISVSGDGRHAAGDVIFGRWTSGTGSPTIAGTGGATVNWPTGRTTVRALGAYFAIVFRSSTQADVTGDLA